ncbi:MAG: glycine cleavage system aminomethyltransferase GcvT [Caulobacterales bacterium]
MGETALKKLPLDGLHRAAGAKFGGFAGYDMPLTYPDGVLAEHAWTRTKAGLFDVSHMGPCFFALPKGHGLTGDDAHKAVAKLIERLVPGDIQGLKPGQVRYTVLLNEAGGALDDLMIARPSQPESQGDLYIVVNAGCKEADWALIEKTVGADANLVRADDRALLALQGPAAESVLAALMPEAAALGFMQYGRLECSGFGRLTVTRSGYTGEDGFEILVKPADAAGFAEKLLSDARVKWIGLGARDSLRLEAGLCLYGHDLDETTSPIEADLAWIIQKRRRGLGDFPGGARILKELEDGPARKRVGIVLKDRAPAREGVEIAAEGRVIGKVTSGGWSAALNAPISMGYVATDFAAPGTALDLMVRGQPRAGIVTAMPFVPHRYKKGS